MVYDVKKFEDDFRGKIRNFLANEFEGLSDDEIIILNMVVCEELERAIKKYVRRIDITRW